MSAIHEARSRYRDDGDELEPIVAATGADADPDDFSSLDYNSAMAMADKIFALGHQRKAQLDKVITANGAGDYVVPYSSKNQYADFGDIANWEYLHEKYPWLHADNVDWIGIDDTKASESHKDLETFLASVPHEDWNAFITDVNGLEDYPLLDEEGASELEMKEADRWLTEDGTPELVKTMIEDRADAYEGYLLSKVTDSDVYEWMRETGHYPEPQGEGSVYMNMERYGKESKTQDWFLEQIEDDVEGWTAVKRACFDSVISAAESGLKEKRVSDLFDAMLRQMAHDNSTLVHVYNNITDKTLWEMFLEAFPDEHRNDDDPYWFTWSAGFEQPTLWKCGYKAPKEHYNQNWTVGYAQALEHLRHAPWFNRLIGSWEQRPPEGHQELKFEALVREALEKTPDPDDAETFVRHGGGLREDVVYEDGNIVVMYPRDVETLNHHLRKLGYTEVTPETFRSVWKGNDKDAFVILGKDNADLLGKPTLHDLGVIHGDYARVVGYDGNYTAQALNNLLTLPRYGASISRMLRRYFREQAEHNSSYVPALMQLGGAAEMRRLERRGALDLSAYGVTLGLHYIDRKKYKLAAKAFNRPPETIEANGVWLIYSHVTDLMGVFKNEKAAEAVFDHEAHDWFSHYYEEQNRPDVSDVIKFLSPDAIKHIREVMQNRRVWFPDGGPDGEGEYVLLTKKLLDAYDDDTILDWLAKPSEQDIEDGVFDDIIEEVKLVGCDILNQTAEDAVYTGFIKAAVEAIDGIQHKWGTSKIKRTKSGPEETFEVFVRWNDVKQWANTYLENTGSPFEGSLEDLAVEANRETIDPDVNNMEPSWRDVKKEWVADNMDRIFQLKQQEAEPLPEPRGQTTLAFENDASPEEEARAAALMKEYGVGEPDYDLAAAEKKSDDAGQTMAHKRKIATSFLQKQRLGESLESDAPEAMPEMLSGIPVEFEKQVKAIVHDVGAEYNFTVNDLKLEFNEGQQYTDEEIASSDGRLYNPHGSHHILLVTYTPVPEAPHDAMFKAYMAIRSAVIGTFKNYDFINGYSLNPDASDRPEGATIFQFVLALKTGKPVVQPPAEDIPF